MTEIPLQQYCQQIEETIEQGRYAEAVAHVKHILKHYPKHVATYRLLGKAMLEAGQDEYAADMFRRVLSADPEDLTAWAGMSEVYNRRDELDAAVWYLERAFELATDNKAVEEELRHLYGRRDGLEPHRVQLTRGALARLYLKGDLLSRAIGELRALLAEHPNRVDLMVALAEALWRNEQRLEASEVCQKVLDELPYCLKANLILGEIWTSSGREEGQMYMRRAEALDPENRMALELFGSTSPLPAREVRITPLEYRPPTEEERPAWIAEVEALKPPLTEREAALVDIAAALEAQIEIPSWLEEISVGEEAPAPAEPPEERPSEEAVPAPAEEVPEWSAGIHEEFVEEKPEAVAEAEVPEWLAEVGVEAVGETGGEEEAPSALPAEQPPEWLVGLREQFAEEAQAPEEAAPAEPTPAPAEIPEWLREIAPPEVEAPVVEEAPSVEEIAPPEAPKEMEAPPVVEAPAMEEAPAAEGEVPLPAWLEGEGMPSGDEALAWLEQLVAGKEEELRAQVEAEAEARMAEIMGRPRPTVAPPEEAVPEEAVAPPVEEAPPVEPAFGWTAFGEVEAPPVEEAAPPEAPGEVEAPPAAEAPAVEEVPSVEEAAPPEVPEWPRLEEAEVPPKVEITVVEEGPSPEEVAAPEVAPSTEEARWGAALEVPLEEEVAPAPVIEEVPGVPEMEIAGPLEEAVAPPEAPTVEVPAEPFAAERAYLKEHPRDYEAWLSLARALWQAGEQGEALEAYTRVIRAGKFLDSVIADLEEHVEQQPDASTQRVLGDAYMKDGRLQEALNIYRQALETL